MQDTYRIMVDPQAIYRKPIGGEAREIHERLEQMDCTLEQFYDYVATGHTFAPAEYEGNRSNATWRSQQLFCLDIDGKLAEKSAAERCIRYGIKPCCQYHTFSSTDSDPRYRLVFRLDQRVDDIRLRYVAMYSLLALFPEADKCCRDAARMIYPAKQNTKSRFWPTNISALPDLVTAAVSFIKETDRSRHAGRKIAELCSLTSLSIIGDLPYCVPADERSQVGNSGLRVLYTVAQPAVSRPHENPCESATARGAESADPSAMATSGFGPYYLKDRNHIAPGFASSHSASGGQYDFSATVADSERLETPTATDTLAPGNSYVFQFELTEEEFRDESTRSRPERPARVPIHRLDRPSRKLRQGFDFDLLRANCRLFAEFRDGKPCHHNVTFGIYTNLLCLKGGKAILSTGMQKRYEATGVDDQWKWSLYAEQILNAGYRPERCARYCPYSDSCQHGRNMLEQVGPSKGKIIRLEQDDVKPTVSQVAADMESAIDRCLNTSDRKVHIIKVPTGIGKTCSLCGRKGFMLCLPTHDRARETYDTAVALGNDPILVEELPSVDDDFDERLAKYYGIGDFRSARSLIQRRVDEAHARPDELRSAGDTAIIQYADDLALLDNPQNRLVICTHHRALLMDPDHLPYETVVFDEDVLLKSQLPLTEVSIADLESLPCMARICSSLRSSPIGKVKRFPSNRLAQFGLARTEAKASRNWADNVLRVYQAAKYVRTDDEHVTIGCTLPLPENCTVIVTSATASPELYEKMNPGRVVVECDVQHAESAGKIVQYPAKSFSRHRIRQGKLHDALRGLAMEHDGTKVLTLNAVREDLKYHRFCVDDLCIESCEGSNRLENQELLVIGTPNLPESAYLLVASLLGIRYSSTDRLEYVPIRRNGYWYWTMTYPNNAELRDLQLHMVESALIQAVGRARTLRYEVTCYVAANVILPNVDRIDELPELPKVAVDLRAA